MRAHLLAPDWSVWRQVGLDYISRLNWSKQGLPLVLAADKFDMGENTMKVSKVKGIDLRKKGIGGGEQGGGGGGGEGGWRG